MNPPIRRIGLLFKKHDPRVPEIVRETVPWLRAQGVEVLVDEDLARQLPGSSTACPPEDLAARAEAVAGFGGHRTPLHAARPVSGGPTPGLGLKLCSLGFLTLEEREEA